MTTLIRVHVDGTEQLLNISAIESIQPHPATENVYHTIITLRRRYATLNESIRLYVDNLYDAIVSELGASGIAILDPMAWERTE